ncbi:hypothetical protein HMSSN139_40010 [Paenibacillus sp. HMSSN-139]|nr:hypothetical protein HMSSN139_40010 [Paenibacillus sp. HMSSN-139]
MEYRRLGGSGLKVSEISLGSWLTYGGYVERENAEKSIKTAYDLGINFFDTANVYEKGAAEELVGKALKAYPGNPMYSLQKRSGRWAKVRTTAVCRANTSWSRCTRV